MLAALAVLALVLAAAPARGQAAPPLAWVDVHVHTVARSGAEAETAVRQALAAMDEADVERAVILPTPQGPADRQAWDYTEVRDAVRRHPQRLAFLAGGGTGRSSSAAACWRGTPTCS